MYMVGMVCIYRTDAVPYFRMFNPSRQSERFDKDALYIKTFIPQLNDVTPKLLHEPFKHEAELEQEGIKLGQIIQNH